MTIAQCIENVTDWLNESVCPKIKLKLPDDNQNGKEYKVKAVNPTAFAMYQPGKDKLPPGVIAPFPSVVVQLLEGTDNMAESYGRMKLQLSFTAWNPGNHAGELTRATQTTTASGSEDLDVQIGGVASEQTFTRDAEGWKDVWNFVDRALREIENAEYLNGLRVVKELPITYGQFQQEGQISDLYPYWGAWAIFTIERGLARTGASDSEFL